jgi:hypothetical protein
MVAQTQRTSLNGLPQPHRNQINMTEPEIEKLKSATLDPKAAIEYATDLALNNWGAAHELADDKRVELAKERVKLQDENPTMSVAWVKMRIEATDLFREYLRAEHKVERIEEFIKIAKKHADIARF